MQYKVTEITKKAERDGARRDSGKRFYAVKLPQRVTTNGISAHVSDEVPDHLVLVQFGSAYHIKKAEEPAKEFPALGAALKALVDPAGTFLLKCVLWLKIAD